MLRSLTTVVLFPLICAWEFFRVSGLISFVFCCDAFVLYNTRDKKCENLNIVLKILQIEHEDTGASFFPSGNLRWLSSLLRGGLKYPLSFWHHCSIIAARNARRAYILVHENDLPPEWTYMVAVELPALLHLNKSMTSIKMFNLSEPQAPYVGEINRESPTSPWKIEFTGDTDERKNIKKKTKIKFEALFEESLKRRQPMPYSKFLALRLKKCGIPATTASVQTFMGETFTRLLLSKWVD
mmetsp:Transcript_28200/g.45894  ORF Transcript_28200/g.45894 Transcript_28200/m.45894 type:complete len:240 (-) Transcript_28200:326-1045(-)